MTDKIYFVYIVRCVDNTLYCGITTDVERRLAEHNAGTGAKYTRGRRPVTLKAFWQMDGRGLALREEYRIKHLSKCDKLLLIEQFNKDEMERCKADPKYFMNRYCVIKNK